MLPWVIKSTVSRPGKSPARSASLAYRILTAIVMTGSGCMVQSSSTHYCLSRRCAPTMQATALRSWGCVVCSTHLLRCSQRDLEQKPRRYSRNLTGIDGDLSRPHAVSVYAFDSRANAEIIPFVVSIDNSLLWPGTQRLIYLCIYVSYVYVMWFTLCSNLCEEKVVESAGSTWDWSKWVKFCSLCCLAVRPAVHS